MAKPIKRRAAFSIGYLALVSLAASLVATPGDIDCTFGSGGRAAIGFQTSESFLGIVLQAQGAIVGAGSLDGNVQVMRWLGSGEADPLFGLGGLIALDLAVDVVTDVAVDSNDRIIVVGSRIEDADIQAFVARLTSEGALDTTFANGGWTSFRFAAQGAEDRALGVAIDASNRILIGGFSDLDGAIPGQRDVALARFTEAGAPDPSFGTDGRVLTNSGSTRDDTAQALRLTEDSIVLLGSSHAIGAPRDTFVARYRAADGSLDASFAGDGTQILDLSGGGDDFGHDLAIDGDGRIIGSAFGPNGNLLVFRLANDGDLDPDFGDQGVREVPFVQKTAEVPTSVALQTDGKALIAGSTQDDFALLRLTTSGELDPTFGDNGQVTLGVGNNANRGFDLAIQPDGKVLVGGTTVTGSVANPIVLPVVLRFLNDGHPNRSTVTRIESDTPDPSAIGQLVTVHYSVTSGSGTPTGDVVVSDGTDSCLGTVEDGRCSLSLSTLGHRLLAASYAGNGTFCPSSHGEPHTVRTATLTTITADSPDPSLPGQAVTVTVQVTAQPPSGSIPTGAVTVDDGAGETCVISLTEGQGACALPSSVTGIRDWTASYAGNADFLESAGTATHHVLDVEPPTVQRVNSRPDTGNGMVEPCESTRARIETLDLIFSEALRTGGGADAADNPNNYRVFATGDDLSLSTQACGPPVGDDLAVALAGVTYLPATPHASRSTGRVILERKLGDGAYRLIACAAIADMAGNPLDGDGSGMGGNDFTIDFRIDTANLLTNSHFDCDLEPWWLIPTGTSQITHSPVDADGAEQSGSGLLSNTGGLMLSLGQCAAPAGGLAGNFQLSARFRVDATAGVEAGIGRACELFDNATCAGAPMVVEAASDLLPDTANGFVEQAHTFDAPAGAQSVFCDVTAASGDGSPWNLFVDQLVLQRTPIFGDGFESGDLSAWTGNVP